MRLLISLFILFILGLEVSTFFHDKRIWPFMDYSMYSTSHEPPIRTELMSLFATDSSGHEIEVTHTLLGVDWFELQSPHIQRVYEGNRNFAEDMADHLQRLLGVRFVRLRAELQTWQLIEGRIRVETDSRAISLAQES